eukprot:787367-Alexandrium_andersonii.AAC.1
MLRADRGSGPTKMAVPGVCEGGGSQAKSTRQTNMTCRHPHPRRGPEAQAREQAEGQVKQ